MRGAAGLVVAVIAVLAGIPLLAIAPPAGSATSRSVDITLHDFFAVPAGGFEDYWVRRSQSWLRDQVVHGTFPYVFRHTPDPGRDPGNTFLMGNYRMSVRGRSLPEMSIDEPVFLPRLGRTTTAGGFAHAVIEMSYLDRSEWEALLAAGRIVMGWNYNDGYAAELRATVTMDALGAEKVLGLTGNPLAWWSSNAGRATDAWASWLDREGNDRLDVYSATRAAFADLTTVLDLSVSGGLVVLTVSHASWGIDALVSRWAYWGTADYMVESPAGFLPFEMHYDDFWMDANLTATTDLDLEADVDYGLKAWAATGTEGPVAVWVWEPTLLDAIPSESGVNPRSELDAYAGRTYVHRTPGSPRYGASLPYEYVPAAVSLEAGESLSILLSEDRVWFYEPPAGTVVEARMGLGRVAPDAGFTWSPEGRLLRFVGPYASGAGSTPDAGMPWAEIAVAASGGGGSKRRHP